MQGLSWPKERARAIACRQSGNRLIRIERAELSTGHWGSWARVNVRVLEARGSRKSIELKSWRFGKAPLLTGLAQRTYRANPGWRFLRSSKPHLAIPAPEN